MFTFTVMATVADDRIQDGSRKSKNKRIHSASPTATGQSEVKKQHIEEKEVFIVEETSNSTTGQNTEIQVDENGAGNELDSTMGAGGTDLMVRQKTYTELLALTAEIDLGPQIVHELDTYGVDDTPDSLLAKINRLSAIYNQQQTSGNIDDELTQLGPLLVNLVSPNRTSGKRNSDSFIVDDLERKDTGGLNTHSLNGENLSNSDVTNNYAMENNKVLKSMSATLDEVKQTVTKNASAISNLSARIDHVELHMDSSIQEVHSKLETCDRDRSEMRNLLCKAYGYIDEQIGTVNNSIPNSIDLLRSETDRKLTTQKSEILQLASRDRLTSLEAVGKLECKHKSLDDVVREKLSNLDEARESELSDMRQSVSQCLERNATKHEMFETEM